MFNKLDSVNLIGNDFKAVYKQELCNLLKTTVNHPASCIIKYIVKDGCKNLSKELNLNWNNLKEITSKGELTKCDCIAEIDNELRTPHKLKCSETFYSKIVQTFFYLYHLNTKKHFIYNSYASDMNTFLQNGVPTNISQYNFIEVFDEIPSMYVNIKTKCGYAPYTIVVDREELSFIQGKEPSEHIRITITVPRRNKAGVFDTEGQIGRFYIAKNIHPSIIVDDTFDCGFSRTCSYCVKVEYNHTITKVISDLQNDKIIHYTAKDISSIPACLVHKNKIINERCLLAYIKPYDILHIIAYVWDMYKSRHTLERSNSKRRGAYVKNEVSIIENDTAVNSDEPLIIPLHNYTKYEREKKSWQGGHHQSPVEHERRSHERILRNDDGSIRKIVQVRGSTINKGGRKAIYKVDEPKSNGKMDLF